MAEEDKVSSIYPEVYDHFKRPPEAFEKEDQSSITETAGYVPPDVQIGEMMLAGRRLVEAREDQYDFRYGEEVPEDFYDPTRSPGFDFDDAKRLGDSVAARLKKQGKEASEKLKGNISQNGKEDASKGQESASEAK